MPFIYETAVESACDVSASKPSVGPPRAVGAATDEYVLVGGGLQNALIAWAVLDRRPDARLTLVEREPQLGGNHTWCFHESDVPDHARALLEPLVARRWPAHDVAFPSHRRRVPGAYFALTSQRLHERLTERLARSARARLIVASARQVEPDAVTLEDGRRLSAQLVVDSRGPEHTRAAPGGYQKFVGLELAVEAGSAPDVPMLMDATVQQLDGFRFVYVLPWANDRVLVEDTYYSTDAALDTARLRERVLAYAAAAGMRVQSILREEQGVLPIPTQWLGSDHATGGPLKAGYAGGLFHPTTGYSLPVALRLAAFVAERSAASVLGPDLERWLAAHRQQARYCIWLNRLLFGAFAPAERYHVLERFYRLPDATIRRFYALESSAADRARILCGRPPAGFSLRRLLAGGNPHE